MNRLRSKRAHGKRNGVRRLRRLRHTRLQHMAVASSITIETQHTRGVEKRCMKRSFMGLFRKQTGITIDCCQSAMKRACKSKERVRHTSLPRWCARAGLCCALALSLSCANLAGGIHSVNLAGGVHQTSLLPAVSYAYADTPSTDNMLDELQKKIEESSQTYEAAKDKLARIKQEIRENEQEIQRINDALPLQEKRGQHAAHSLYKIQSDSSSILSMLLDSHNFSQFIFQFTYIIKITKKNFTELNTLKTMRERITNARMELNTHEKEATLGAQQAESALREAQNARKEAQRRAQEELERQAQELAKAQQNSSGQDVAKTVQALPGTPNISANHPQAKPDPAPVQTQAAPAPAPAPKPAITGSVKADHANWNSDEEAFVKQWGARINAYLGSSPLGGHGETFARAAWRHGIDPRFSPAISMVESTQGRHCFRPHNAWGWGNSSWSSWDEAINAHVAGLARGYGYTLTLRAAKKYCPPTWEDWYNKVSNQINRI